MKKVLFIVVSLFMMSAQAQTFGIQGGIHQSNGESDPGSDTEDAKLNYRVGVLGLVDLSDKVYFRTGLTYTTRYLTYDAGGGADFDAKFAYLDVPVLFQFQFTDVFSLYAGGVVGFNASKKAEVSGGGASGDMQDVESMLILAQVGLNFMFDGIGFDVYYERSMTDLRGDDGGNQSKINGFNTIGANFVMLF